MHCEILPVVVGTAALAIPAYVTLRLWSIRRLNREARGEKATATGVSFGEARAPSFAERLVEKAFEARDRAITELLLERLPKGAKVLDVGCGDGKLLARLRDQGFDVYGIDLDIEMVESSAKRVGAQKVRTGDFLQCWSGEEVVDAVLFCDSLRYTTRPHHLLKRALDVAPVVIVTEPFQFWHSVGRIVFLRFLFRVGHLSKLNLTGFKELRRTLFHNIWIMLRSPRPDESQRIQVLNEEVQKEADWIVRHLLHPGLDSRIYRIMWTSGVATFAGALSVLSYLVMC